jgi:hypothetical protein
MSSSLPIALLPPRVRKECHELASNIPRVQDFVAKFTSMGFMCVTEASAGASQAEHHFMCSDMISFLFNVEKLCPSREAALYVPSHHSRWNPLN